MIKSLPKREKGSYLLKFIIEPAIKLYLMESLMKPQYLINKLIYIMHI